MLYQCQFSDFNNYTTVLYDVNIYVSKDYIKILRKNAEIISKWKNF